MRMYVNGELRQQEITGEMVANIYQQIEHLSAAMTLEPGDILATGTPSGVGIRNEAAAFSAGGRRSCARRSMGLAQLKTGFVATPQ